MASDKPKFCDYDDIPLSVRSSELSNVGKCSSNCDADNSVKKKPITIAVKRSIEGTNSFRASVKKIKVSSLYDNDEDGNKEDDMPISCRMKRLAATSADKSFSAMKKIVVNELALIEKSLEQCQRMKQVEEIKYQSLKRDNQKYSKELRTKKEEISSMEDCVKDLVAKGAQLRLMEDRIGEHKQELKIKEKELHQVKTEAIELRQFVEKEREKKDEELEQLSFKISECSRELKTKEKERDKMDVELKDLSIIIAECSRELKTKEKALDELKVLIAAQEKGLESERKGLLKILSLRNEQRAQMKRFESMKKESEDQVKEVESKQKQCEGQVKELEVKEKRFEERVKELESKEKKLISHEEEVESKLKQCEGQVKELEVKEKRFEERVKELESKEMKLQSHEEEVESKQKQCEGQVKELEAKEKQFEERVKELESKEKKLESHEEEVESKQQQCEGQVKKLEAKEKQFEERVKELESKEKKLQSHEEEVESKQKQCEGQVKELEVKEKRFEERVKELAATIKKHSEIQQKELKLIQNQFEGQMKELEESKAQIRNDLEKEFKSKENQFKRRVDELESKEKQLEGRAKKFEAKEKEFEGRVKEFELKEKQFEGQEMEFQSREPELEGRVKEIKSIMRYLESRVDNFKSKEMQGKELELTSKVKHLESQRNNFEGYLKDLELREKPSIESFEEDKESVTSCTRNQSSLTNYERSLQLVLSDQTHEPDERNLQLVLSEQKDEPDERSLQLVLSEQTHEPDERNLQLVLIDEPDDVLVCLLESSDPSKDVLDIIHNPTIPLSKEEDNAVIIDGSHIFLLQQLLQISPQVKPHAREKAMNLALGLKAFISENHESSTQVLGFLLLVSIYGLVPSFDQDEILKIFGFAAQHEIAVKLFGTLDFADKAYDFVENLIKKQQHIEAVRFICAYNLADKFQPVDLLREYVQIAKLNSVLECRKTRSLKTKDKARDQEIANLETVLKCISDNTLQSEDLLKAIRYRILELNRQNGK